MTRLLAIDPGNTESAYVIIDENYRAVQFDKINNYALLRKLYYEYHDLELDHAVIEMVASYGMAVGADVFETCVWTGRFYEAIFGSGPLCPKLIKRAPIKMHLCHSTRAKDTNITQALVDRFAYGQPNLGKGTKSNPGFFHGFHSDIWQAYALAVFALDIHEGIAA